MKKRNLAIMLCMMLWLTGCGAAETGEEEVSTTESSVSSENIKGYVFAYQGTEVVIDALAEPVLTELGEAQSYFEAASCAFDGLDKMYTYGSVEIDTYPSEEGDRISAILFKDDMVQTKEGISLFMTKADMTAAYGEDYTEENGMLVYSKDGMKLRFILENEEITSIEYVTTVLD